MKTRLLSIVSIVLLSSTCAGQDNQTNDAASSAVGRVTAHAAGLHGYIGFSATRPPAAVRVQRGDGFLFRGLAAD